MAKNCHNYYDSFSYGFPMVFPVAEVCHGHVACVPHIATCPKRCALPWTPSSTSNITPQRKAACRRSTTLCLYHLRKIIGKS